MFCVAYETRSVAECYVETNTLTSWWTRDSLCHMKMIRQAIYAVCVCVWGGGERKERGEGGGGRGEQVSCVYLAAGLWYPQGVRLCEGKSSHCQ